MPAHALRSPHKAELLPVIQYAVFPAGPPFIGNGGFQLHCRLPVHLYLNPYPSSGIQCHIPLDLYLGLSAGTDIEFIFQHRLCASLRHRHHGVPAHAPQPGYDLYIFPPAELAGDYRHPAVRLQKTAKAFGPSQLIPFSDAEYFLLSSIYSPQLQYGFPGSILLFFHLCEVDPLFCRHLSLRAGNGDARTLQPPDLVFQFAAPEITDLNPFFLNAAGIEGQLPCLPDPAAIPCHHAHTRVLFDCQRRFSRWIERDTRRRKCLGSQNPAPFSATHNVIIVMKHLPSAVHHHPGVIQISVRRCAKPPVIRQPAAVGKVIFCITPEGGMQLH